jgi:hypothetical protein
MQKPISVQHMQNAIYRRMCLQRSHKHAFANTYWNGYEADLITVSQSDYAYEWEIKRSRSDLKADLKKQVKHYMFGTKDASIPEVTGRKKAGALNRPTHYMPREAAALDDPSLSDRYYQLKYPFTLALRPKHFTYVCSGFDVKPKDVPEYAGLVVLSGSKRGRHPRWEVLKESPALPSVKVSEEMAQYQLRKLEYRYWQARLRVERK